MSTIADRLAALDNDYAKAPVGGDFELPPDGIYQAVVDRFDTFEPKNGNSAGKLLLKTTFKIELDPKYTGKQVDIIHSLEDADKFQWLKKHLQTLGLDPESFQFSDLMDQLHTVLDVPCELAIVTSDKTNPNTGEPYRNAYLNRRLGDALPSKPKAKRKPKDPTQTGASDVPSSMDPGPEDGDPGMDDDDTIPFMWDGPRSYEQRYHRNR